MAAADVSRPDECGTSMNVTSKQMDRPRPGANQTGAGSPATQHGVGEGTSMTQEGTGPLAGRQWTYWVAYSHASGLGAVAVCAEARLATPGQVVGLAGRIGRDAGLRDVVILSWQPLVPAVQSGRPDPADPRRAGGEDPGPGEVSAGPAESGSVDLLLSTPQGVAVRAEVVALAHVLEAADRVGVSVISTNCRAYPPLPSGDSLPDDAVGGRVELGVHLDGAGWGRGTAEDAVRLLAEAGCVGEPVARRYAGGGDSRDAFETRTGRFTLPGGVAVELKVFCEPTDRDADADADAEPVAGGER